MDGPFATPQTPARGGLAEDPDEKGCVRRGAEVDEAPVRLPEPGRGPVVRVPDAARGRRARRHGVRRPLEHHGLQLGSCAPTPAPTPGPATSVQSACTSHGDCSKACGPGLETRTHTTTTYAAYGGTACGSLSDYAACNLGSCAPTPVLTLAPSTA